LLVGGVLVLVALAVGIGIGMLLPRVLRIGPESPTSSTGVPVGIRLEELKSAEEMFVLASQEAVVLKYSGGDVMFWVEIESQGEKQKMGDDVGMGGDQNQLGTDQTVEGYFVWVRSKPDDEGRETWTIGRRRDLVTAQASGVQVSTPLAQASVVQSGEHRLGTSESFYRPVQVWKMKHASSFGGGFVIGVVGSQSTSGGPGSVHQRDPGEQEVHDPASGYRDEHAGFVRLGVAWAVSGGLCTHPGTSGGEDRRAHHPDHVQGGFRQRQAERRQTARKVMRSFRSESKLTGHAVRSGKRRQSTSATLPPHQGVRPWPGTVENASSGKQGAANGGALLPTACPAQLARHGNPRHDPASSLFAAVCGLSPLGDYRLHLSAGGEPLLERGLEVVELQEIDQP
jgi:hypothetical protein